MAIYNGGFPASYQPVYQQQFPPYQQIYQQQPFVQSQNVPQQDMTPTIHAEIKQVDSIEAIDRVPLGAGTSQMFMTKDEQTIVIRSMFANGQHSDVVYDKRPPAPPAPKFDPADYVRRDEVEMLVSAAIMAQQKVSES